MNVLFEPMRVNYCFYNHLTIAFECTDTPKAAIYVDFKNPAQTTTWDLAYLIN